MAAEFVRHLYQEQHPEFSAGFIPRRVSKPDVLLDPLITEAFNEASIATSHGALDLAHRLYGHAAKISWEKYSRTRTRGMTSETRRIRGHYAELAVIGYVTANLTIYAEEAAEILSHDRHFPQAALKRIHHLLEAGHQPTPEK